MIIQILILHCTYIIYLIYSVICLVWTRDEAVHTHYVAHYIHITSIALH